MKSGPPLGRQRWGVPWNIHVNETGRRTSSYRGLEPYFKVPVNNPGLAKRARRSSIGVGEHVGKLRVTVPANGLVIAIIIDVTTLTAITCLLLAHMDDAVADRAGKILQIAGVIVATILGVVGEAKRPSSIPVVGKANPTAGQDLTAY